MRAESCLALILLAALCPAPVAAQWFSYPTPGIPRLADGKPNLTAPAPKTRDGKPDLSGIWKLMADTELIEFMCENEKDLAHLVGK